MVDLEPYTLAHFVLHRKLYLDRKEAMRRLGVHRNTITNYVRDGLRVYETALGGEYLFEPDLLAMYRSKLKSNPARPRARRAEPRR